MAFSKWVDRGTVVSGVLAMLGILAYASSAAALQCPATVQGGLPVTGCIAVTTTVPFFPDDDGHCSLYEAINAIANHATTGSCVYRGGENVVLLPAGQYYVPDGLGVYVNNPGESITLYGAGVGQTIIWTDVDLGGPQLETDQAGIEQLTVQGRNLTDSTTGVRVFPDVSGALYNVEVYGFNGGGVYIDDGADATIVNSTIHNNTNQAKGGGIVIAGTFGRGLTLLSSTIRNNTSSSNGGGLAITTGSTVEISDSTFSNNTASGNGGGISVESSGELFLTYSTVANNTAALGAGVYASSTATSIGGYQSTVAFNHTTGTVGSCGASAGVYTAITFSDWNGSIIAGNTNRNNALDDFSGTIHGNSEWTDGANPSLLSHYFCTPSGWRRFEPAEPLPDGTTAPGATLTDNVYTVSQLFGSNVLNSNGGPTQTVLLSPTSPAIDATQNPVDVGDGHHINVRGTFSAVDQRGQPSLYNFPTNTAYDLGALEMTPQALPRTGWTATASSSATGNAPANALDGNSSTRWSTGRGQANGQWFLVDMKAAQTFDKITLDAATSTGDYPRGYQVFVSNDGVNFGASIASGSGSSQLVTVLFHVQTARYLKVVQTGTAQNWWSIHEFTVWN